MLILSNLPSGWDEVSVVQFQEIKQADQAEGEALDVFESNLEKLAVLLDTTTDDRIFDEMSVDDAIQAFKKLKWLGKNPSPTGVKDEINGRRLLATNRLTLGEFIDLEHYFSNNFHDNLHYICAVLYKGSKADEWGNEVREPYSYDIEIRADEYLDLPVTDVYGIIKYYIDFKTKFLEQYAPLFNDPDDLEIGEDEDLTPEERRELEMEMELEKRKQAFSWERMIYDLGGQDITKFDDVTNLPLVYVFNTMSMLKG